MYPYRQGDNKYRATRSDGVGLGLAIVTTLAQAVQADLKVEPRRGGGLRSSIRFKRMINISQKRREEPVQKQA